MEFPEYLSLFSNQGEWVVNVKFKDFSGKVVDSKMSPNEIIKLINPANNEFYTKIYFDGYLFEVYKYHIDPIKKKLTIMAREIRQL